MCPVRAKGREPRDLGELTGVLGCEDKARGVCCGLRRAGREGKEGHIERDGTGRNCERPAEGIRTGVAG